MSVTTFVESVCLALPVVGVAGLWVWKRGQPWWERAFPGLAATALAIVFVGASYLWLFTHGTCDGRADFACTVNANEGYLTFIALVLALAGLWTAAISKWGEERREIRRRVAEVREVVYAATDECLHNLTHVGGFCDRNGNWAVGMPQLTMATVPQLGDVAYRPFVHREVLEAADALVRNFDRLRDRPINLAELVAEDNERKARGEEEGHGDYYWFQSFVVRSIVLLVNVLRRHPGFVSDELAAEPRLGRLREAAAEIDSRRGVITFESGDVADEAADMRVSGNVLIVWWDDEHIEDLETFEVAPLFIDRATGHRH